jgi:hypothetical protein
MVEYARAAWADAAEYSVIETQLKPRATGACGRLSRRMDKGECVRLNVGIDRDEERQGGAAAGGSGRKQTVADKTLRDLSVKNS